MDVTVEALAAADIPRHRTALVGLIMNAVDSGASIGFLPPAYWDTVATAVRDGSRLLVARPPGGGIVAGSVQLDLARGVNARHRAEVTRLMVHRDARRQGRGRALMRALADQARPLGRTTLVLDTRQGDPSERLYRSLGWTFVGAIPRYAASADGTLHATAIYYRLLDPA